MAMTVAFVFEGEGITAEVYDGLMEQVGRGDVNVENPGGLVAHIAGPTAEGWRVVDLWESEQAADAFYGSADFQRMLTGAPPMQQEAWSLHRVEIHEAVRELASRT
jgi:hypothetical protein